MLAVCYLVAVLGGLATAGAVDTWYQGLNQPAFTPPDWIFAPVWTILYTLMGIAAYIVWHNRDTFYLIPFFIQLALNLLWSVAFFGFRSPNLGLVVIITLLIGIIITTFFFFRSSRAAGIMMLPYLAWTMYATALNIGIVLLN